MYADIIEGVGIETGQFERISGCGFGFAPVLAVRGQLVVPSGCFGGPSQFGAVRAHFADGQTGRLEASRSHVLRYAEIVNVQIILIIGGTLDRNIFHADREDGKISLKGGEGGCHLFIPLERSCQIIGRGRISDLE